MTNFADTRSILKKMAAKHGAQTTVGRACHNLLEQTENYAKSVDPEQRRQLAAFIDRQKAHLSLALSQAQ